MTRILQISDLHFGPPFIPAIAEALLAAAFEVQPQFIVVSGDLTQRARREQFADARRFLDRLPECPRIVVPGNHDVPLYRVFERLFAPYRNYREAIGPQLETVLCDGEVCFAALNTTAPLRAITNGRVRRRQLELCREAFSRCPETALKVVVAHHHFAPAPDFSRSEVMPGACEILELLTELRVDLILGGHLHRSYIGNSLDVFAGADREYGIIIVQCGTSTSRRGRGKEREKNSFNMIVTEDNLIKITHYLYFEKEGAFRPESVHFFPRHTPFLTQPTVSLVPPHPAG